MTSPGRQSSLIGRRLFLLLLASQPLFHNNFLANPIKKFALNSSQENEGGFIVLGGWILLESDI